MLVEQVREVGPRICRRGTARSLRAAVVRRQTRQLQPVVAQLIGLSARLQIADQAETMNRCAGRLHKALGSNMWSLRTQCCA